MLEEFIIAKIRQELPFEANPGQTELLRKLGRFLVCQEADKAFILRGYAGTPKTCSVSSAVLPVPDSPQTATPVVSSL